MIWPKDLHRRLGCEVRFEDELTLSQMMSRHCIRAFQAVMNRHDILWRRQNGIDLSLAMPGGR